MIRARFATLPFKHPIAMLGGICVAVLEGEQLRRSTIVASIYANPGISAILLVALTCE
jgi:hypothetical protein